MTRAFDRYEVVIERATLLRRIISTVWRSLLTMLTADDWNPGGLYRVRIRDKQTGQLVYEDPEIKTNANVTGAVEFLEDKLRGQDASEFWDWLISQGIRVENGPDT